MDMYAEHILELYKQPENFGKLQEFTHKTYKKNTFCGDEQTIYLHMKDGIVQDISFEGVGCAISVAATSILTEELQGKTLEDIQNMTEKHMLTLLGIPISSGRMKCATLGLRALQEAISHEA